MKEHAINKIPFVMSVTKFEIMVLSSAVVWVGCCTKNFTDSTSLTGCCSIWQWQFLGVWTAAHHPSPYLSDYCVLVAGADTRRHLRSANRQQLAVPRYRLNTCGRRAFSVVGPTVWNSLPDFIWDPTISADCFRLLLKTYLFALYHCITRVRGS